jgi:hypothetical protein
LGYLGYKNRDTWNLQKQHNPNGGSKKKWCAQGDDFRTFLRGFVASLTVSNFEAGEAVYQNTPFI